MYDPARDIFTSDEAPSTQPDEAEDGSFEKSGLSDASKPALTEDKASMRDPGVLEPLADSKSTGPGHSLVADERTGQPADEAQQPVKRTKTSPPMLPANKKRTRSQSPAAAEPESKPSTTDAVPEETATKAVGEKVADMADDGNDTRTKKRKLSPPADRPSANQSPIPLTAANLPRIPRRKASPGRQGISKAARRTLDNDRRRERSRSPRSRRRSRSPVEDRTDGRLTEHRRSRSPVAARRSPSPPSRSPPRKLKRPGGASRLSAAEKEALRKKQLERQDAESRASQVEAATRGTYEVVKEHYNAVPERGRDWRKTQSTIRGLRSFNNWIKSTIIQKFSPDEHHRSGEEPTTSWAEGFEGGGIEAERRRGLIVLDVGCGKGGDLGKWQQAPQPLELYVGLDPAEVSIEQARERYRQMRRDRRGSSDRGGWRRPAGGRHGKEFQAEFFVADGFGSWLGDIPLVREVGIDDAVQSRWGGGGFDVVSMMFCMHYAFESEAKVKGMLRNVAGALKKGGRFIGVIPNSDVISQKVLEHHQRSASTAPNREQTPTETGPPERGDADQEDADKGGAEKEGEDKASKLEWGNSIYRVQFPAQTPKDGIFRPPFGWKYNYFLEEAVEGVPEYVVPWEAFRALTEDYNLELQYRRPFVEVWNEEKDDPILGPLSERMNVRERGRGPLLVTDEEMEAAGELSVCVYTS